MDFATLDWHGFSIGVCIGVVLGVVLLAILSLVLNRPMYNEVVPVSEPAQRIMTKLMKLGQEGRLYESLGGRVGCYPEASIGKRTVEVDCLCVDEFLQKGDFSAIWRTAKKALAVSLTIKAGVERMAKQKALENV